MEEKVKKFLESRLTGLVETTTAFNEYITNTSKELDSDQATLKAKKKANPNISWEDLKEDIVSVNKKFYKVSLVEQNWRTMAYAITEVLFTAQSLGIELELPEEVEKIVKDFPVKGRDLFTVDKGEVVPVDKDYYESLEKMMEESVDKSDAIKQNFDAI